MHCGYCPAHDSGRRAPARELLTGIGCCPSSLPWMAPDLMEAGGRERQEAKPAARGSQLRMLRPSGRRSDPRPALQISVDRDERFIETRLKPIPIKSSVRRCAACSGWAAPTHRSAIRRPPLPAAVGRSWNAAGGIRAHRCRSDRVPLPIWQSGRSGGGGRAIPHRLRRLPVGHQLWEETAPGARPSGRYDIPGCSKPLQTQFLTLRGVSHVP